MSEFIQHTDYPPKEKPMMVWDGQCGFCKYWVERWKKDIGERAEFRPFQEVADQYPDIPKRAFMIASRWIETDGSVHSGAKSAFRSLKYAGTNKWLDKWYEEKPWFKKLTDRVYKFIAKNRHLGFKVTKVMFGADPQYPKPYWVLFLAFIPVIIVVLSLL